MNSFLTLLGIMLCSPLWALDFLVPEDIVAGEVTPVEVYVKTSKPIQGTFVASSGVYRRSHPITIEPDIDSQEFLLPGKFTSVAGINTLYLVTPGKTVKKYMKIQPEKSSGVLEFQVAPKTVEASGKDEWWTYALPVDKWLNPAVDGTPVKFWYRPPGGNPYTRERLVKNGVAFRADTTTTEIGKWQVNASTSGSRGIERRFRQISGSPIDFDVKAETAYNKVDGLFEIGLSTGPITDQRGNPMPDGTVVNFLVKKDNKLYGIIPSIVFEGRAKTRFYRPNNPGTYLIFGQCLDTETAPYSLDLDWRPPQKPRFTVVFDRGNMQLKARLRNLAGEFGQWLHRNQKVTLSVMAGKKVVFQDTIAIQRGVAKSNISVLGYKKGEYKVRVAFGSYVNDRVVRVE